MATKAELVKQLRTMTGAGMSDCMKALNETHDDLDGAVEWLRKNGVAKAAKKASAIAAEGVVIAKLSADKKKAVVVEVNCQTDFVAKNENFKEYVNAIVENALAHVKNSEDIANLKINGKSLEELAQDLTAKIGEKIAYRRGVVLTATENETLGVYTHMNSRVASAILLKGEPEEEVATNVAMHIAAMNPRYMIETEVDNEWLSKEKEIIIEQTKTEKSKPAQFLERIIEGRVNKLLQEVCLVSQQYVKEPSKTVKQYLMDNGSVALKMANFVLGEGIEKKQSDFAAEVAEQMGQAK